MSNFKDFFPPGFVEWQSPVTSSMTMEAGKGYPVDTSSGVITMTLPASASLGDTIEINDYKRTFGSNKCTIALNGHKIAGGGFDAEVDTAGSAVTLVYADSTQGWMVQQDDDPPLRSAGPPGNQSFTSTGTATFTVPSGVTSVAVVCIGAGGKAGIGNSGQAGGGGALAYKNNIVVTPGSTGTVTVGSPGNHSGNNGNSGGLSKFNYNGVDYAIANGGGGGNGDGNQSGGNAGGGGSIGGDNDGGGAGGSGGQDAQNFGGPGGGGAGGYSGAGGNGANSVTVLETWELYGAYVQNINYNTMAYATSDPATITLSVRYDNAIQAPRGTGVGTAVARTLGTLVTGGGSTQAV